MQKFSSILHDKKVSYVCIRIKLIVSMYEIRCIYIHNMMYRNKVNAFFFIVLSFFLIKDIKTKKKKKKKKKQKNIT